MNPKTKEQIKKRLREALSIFFTGIVLIDIVFLAFIRGEDFSLDEVGGEDDNIN